MISSNKINNLYTDIIGLSDQVDNEGMVYWDSDSKSLKIYIVDDIIIQRKVEYHGDEYLTWKVETDD